MKLLSGDFSACNGVSHSQMGPRHFCTLDWHHVDEKLLLSPALPQRKASLLWGANSLPRLRAAQKGTPQLGTATGAFFRGMRLSRK